MKKLLLFPLLLITFFAFSQTTPVTVTFRKQTTATDSKDSLAYTYPGKIGNYSYWGNLELMRSLFKLQLDSVSNSGYVTHGYFNAHSGGSVTTLYSGNGVIPSLRQVKLEGPSAEIFIGDTSNTTGLDIRTNTARKIAVDISAQNDSTLSKSADIVLSDNVVQFTSNIVGGNIMQFIMGGGPAHNRMWVYDYQQRGLLSAGDYSTFQISNDSAYTSRKAVNLLIAANPSNFISLSALSATNPIFYNNSTGVISSQAATGSANGYLTATNFNIFNGKQNAITTGSTAQYIRGDLSLATFPTIYTFTGSSGQYTKGDGTYGTLPAAVNFSNTNLSITGNRTQSIGSTYYLNFTSPNGGLYMSELFGNPAYQLSSLDAGSGTVANVGVHSGQINLTSNIGGNLAGIQTDLGGGVNIVDDIQSNGLIYNKHMNYVGLQQIPDVQTVDSLITAAGSGSGITALTGDATATGPGSAALTLATVNSNVGTYGDATHVPAITVNGKGLTTAVTSTAITFPVTSVFGRTGAVISATNDYTFAQIGSKPTSLSGYGITDAYPLSGNPSSFLTANQSITFTPTGDVTGSASGATSLTPALTIGAGKVTNAMLAGSITNANLLNSSTTINGTAISLGASGTVTAAAGTLTGSTLSSGVTSSSLTDFGSSPTLNTAVLTGLPTGSGVSNSATASTLAARDANGEIYGNGFTPNFVTVVSSATPYVLTSASPQVIEFTGSTPQTLTMPVASTLQTGWNRIITSASSGAITIQSSGGNTVATLQNGNSVTIWCVLASGTGLASWDRGVMGGSFSGTAGGIPLTTGATMTNLSLVTPTLGVAAYSSLTGGGINETSGNFTQSFTTLGTASTQGILLRNITSATSGVPLQYSQFFGFENHLWNTSGTPATNQGAYAMDLRGTSGATPTVSLYFKSSLVTNTTNSYTDRFSMDNSGNFTALTGTIILHAFTVSTLPTGVSGMTAYVTDALTPSFGTTLIGGGAVVTKAFYNGTNWIAE